MTPLAFYYDFMQCDRYTLRQLAADRKLNLLSFKS